MVTNKLHLAHLWPNEPARSASAWGEYLADFPLRLPLEAPLFDLADFAQLTWDWPPIVAVQADLLQKYGAPKAA
jgi:hypothetical protein